MAAVTICSDFGAQKIKSDTVSTVSPSRQHIKKQRHYFANKVCLLKAMVFPVVIMDVRVGLERKLSTKELMLLNCGDAEDS